MNAEQSEFRISHEEHQPILEYHLNSRQPPHIREAISDDQLADIGLRYNGFQEGFGRIPGGHLYTRLMEPRTSFMVREGETLDQANWRALRAFRKYRKAPLS